MSIIKKLREEKRSNEEFEVMLKHMTLEEVFFLRLELEDQTFKNNLSGFKIYRLIQDVILEGLIRFAISIKQTKAGAAVFLGVDRDTLEKNMIKYRIPVKTRPRQKKKNPVD